MKAKKNNLSDFQNRINLHVYGLENLPKHGPSIFIANHNCLMDIFYLPAALPNLSVNLISPRLIYKPNLPRQKIINDLLYSMPLEAHGGREYSQICLDKATSILCENIDLTIFPEGAYLSPSNYIYKGRTGAARILYNAKNNGIFPNLVPVAIKIINNNLDLDSYSEQNDIVNVYILPPINYNKFYLDYINTTSFSVKNNALHNVIKECMQNIAYTLNKIYCDKYIQLIPKNNVIFRDGTTINVDLAQNDYYINLYNKELTARKNKILNEVNI